jgi:gamma-glutamylputrescine oxidase
VAASIYYRAKAAPEPVFAALEGRHDTRVAIIGGGLAGLNTALSLTEKGIEDIMVLEAESIGFGASGRNGGFAFAGYSLGEDALIKRIGVARARALFALTVDAVEIIRTRIAHYAIACDAVDAGVIWANWFRDASLLRRRQDLLASQLDVHWQWLDQPEMHARLRTTRYSAGLYERNALHLDPLQYLRGLARAAVARGASIHERSRVVDLTKADDGCWRLKTASGGSVLAREVVLACGGYLGGLARQVDRAVLPIATYVMVTEPLGSRLAETIRTRAAVYDTRFAFDYYRALAGGRLLWGGRISVRRLSEPTIKRLLHQDMQRVYPQLAGARIDYAWSGLMSYARHQMPQLGTAGDGLWWAQAFGGHGLAPTTAAGERLAAAIAEGDDRWREFSEFGLTRAWRPFGYVGAQARYAWLQTRDRFKEIMER